MSDTDHYDHVELRGPQRLLTTCLTRMNELDGRRIPQGTGREASAALADVTRELLFIAHLCDSARSAVLDEYHLSRGFTDHLPMTPTEEV